MVSTSNIAKFTLAVILQKLPYKMQTQIPLTLVVLVLYLLYLPFFQPRHLSNSKYIMYNPADIITKIAINPHTVSIIFLLISFYEY